MKLLKFTILSTAFIFALSCSNSDDESSSENGINKSPNLKPTGTSANHFLASTKYNSLVIEISYAENLRPNSQSIANVKQFLETLLNKPNGITILENEIPTQVNSPFSTPEIAEIENTYRTQYNNPNVLKLHLLFINGNSENDTNTNKTLGVAYRNTSCVLFENSIQQLSNAINEPNRIDLETTVINHEIGHLLGLVNLGSTMQTNHLDTAHDKHCNNSSCLMYWEIETSGVMQMMVGGNIPQLDANCLADLRANGGK